VNITSIDHLDGLSERDIKEIIGLIQVKAALLQQMRIDGEREGLTLDAYNKKVAGREPEDCKACDGTGAWTPPKPREIGVIHPSSAYGCVLKLYYDVTGEIAPRDVIRPELAITFAMGHAIHDVVQGALHRVYGEGFTDEAPIDMVGFVRGNTDGIIYIKLSDGRTVKVVLEIKSAGPSTYDGLRSPVKEHRIQAGGLYATALDAPFTVYLYVSKIWPHPMKEFVEVYDPSTFSGWWRRKGAKVEKALEARAAGEKWPEPVADAKPSECGQCSYEYACKSSLAKKRTPFARTARKK
jgi:CRISPR/Cas system-associated exonuclease Cas4 (RecB family)